MNINDSFKGKDGIDFIPRAKHFFGMNSFMNCTNLNYSILRRCLFFGFDERFEVIPENGAYTPSNPNVKPADPELINKLLEELPGIMNWAIEGYKDLMENKGFAESRQHKELLKSFRLSVSPVASFVADELIRRHDTNDDLRYLYDLWEAWAKNSGFQNMSITKFKERLNEHLEDLIPGIKITGSGCNTYYRFPSERESMASAL